MADGNGNGGALVGWSRARDYILGRNALIGIASFMLLLISGYATWSGMSDFIIGVSTDAPAQDLKGVGGLSFTTDALVIAIVAALTFLMWLTLRESFGAQRHFSERMITFPLYIFLALWSIGFGYGFWWSLIAGQEATRTGLSGLQEDARNAGVVVDARLGAVRAQLDNVVSWSDSQMRREEASGGSCGKNSGAGRGPLYNARKSVRDSVSSLRDGIVASWITPLQSDIKKLQDSVEDLKGSSVADRQKQFENMAASIRGRALALAARSNELGKSTAAEMNALADAVAISPGQVGFSCYDPTLAQRLRQAAAQAGAPARLKLRDASFSEGPAGVANAVKNLWIKIGSAITGGLSYIIPGADKAEDEGDTGEPISGRDLIALLATLGVDLGLFALMALNPPLTGPLRRDGLAKSQAKLHLPTDAVIRHITGAIRTAIARAPGVNLEWVRLHLLYHDGASYFISPNIFASEKDNKEEERRAVAINQLAGVLDDLALIRPLSKSELKFARSEEERADRASAGDPEKHRNHGLLSKAARILDIADWSDGAQQDFEIYRLEDTEGLTPLLTVLNESIIAAQAEKTANAEEDEEIEDSSST